MTPFGIAIACGIIVFLAVPLATVLVPRKYFGLYAGWLGVGAILLIVPFLRPTARQMGEEFFAVAALLVNLFVLLLKLIYIHAASKRRAVKPPVVKWQFDRRLCAAYGFASGFLLAVYLGEQLQTVTAGWKAYALLITILMLFLIPLKFLPAKPGASDYYRGVCLFLVAAFVYSALFPFLVIHNAETLSGEDPYCLEVAQDLDVRPVTALLDLSPPLMRARTIGSGDQRVYADRHAILINRVESRLAEMPWSYWHMNFNVTDTVESKRPNACEPKAHFAAHLPLIIPD